MRLNAFIACLTNHHAPTPYRVKWDGNGYVSRCKVCGSPIRRIARGLWRRSRLARVRGA